MTNYTIQGPNRICDQSGRELKIGELIYSVLIEESGRFARKDFAAETWKGKPENCIAFWSSKIPKSGKPIKPVIRDEILRDCFEHLSERLDPNQEKFRYVIGLLLMRRKNLQFEDLQKNGSDTYLVLRDAKANQSYSIRDPLLREDEMISVQEELFELLGWNDAPGV